MIVVFWLFKKGIAIGEIFIFSSIKTSKDKKGLIGFKIFLIFYKL